VILPPLSIYVHLPWCVRKCPYCDFNSHTAGNAPPKRRYVEALITDLQQQAASVRERPVVSVFLGGGTPSLFSPQEIGRILSTVKDEYNLDQNAEITMEANPGTVECGAPAGYLDAGVNRLSIGAQSFNDEQLQTLGRIHSSADIERAVVAAQEAGFETINIDVMHGLPGQDMAAAMSDLDVAMSLHPQHISWYQLTLEPNTVFFARPPADLPGNDLAFEIQEQGQALLQTGGFHQYEVSAYAQPGKRCLHNLNYWLFGDYLAVGAGAHGKLTVASVIGRYKKPANPLQYMAAIEGQVRAIHRSEPDNAELMFEFMLNGLRLKEGFSEQLFCERTGLSADYLAATGAGLLRRELLERSSDGVWRPTAMGGRFLNDLQAEFLPELA